jgi:flagellar biosynthesis protein
MTQSQAVALSFDGINTPIVTATGCDALAEEILNIAREYEVPIYENPDLSRTLAQLDLNADIPECCYQIIAEIMAFVFYLKAI